MFWFALSGPRTHRTPRIGCAPPSHALAASAVISGHARGVLVALIDANDDAAGGSHD